MGGDAKKVLCVGHYETLQVTRRWILEGAGYLVWNASSRYSARKTASETDLDLAVLCDSLTPAESNEIIADLRKVSPRTKTLYLGNGRSAPAGEPVPPREFLQLVRIALL
jgi:hypothetical protein